METNNDLMVQHAIYMHQGSLKIALNGDTLQDLAGSDTYKIGDASEVGAAVETPGTQEWIDRMVRIRNSLIRRAVRAETSLEAKVGYIESLGQALFEKAQEKEWCEEYDEFAAEWNLPRRERYFEVTMAVRVLATDENAAKDIVADCVSIDKYSTEGIDEDPEYHVSQV